MGSGFVVKAEVGGAEGSEGAAGAPQPLPISLAVMVSGTFIMEDACFGGGDGSAAPHALAPHGSILVENRLLVILEVEEGGGWDACCSLGDESLKTEFVAGDVIGDGPRAEVFAVGDEKRSNILVDVAGGGAFDFVGLILLSAKLKSCPMDGIDGTLAWCD